MKEMNNFLIYLSHIYDLNPKINASVFRSLILYHDIKPIDNEKVLDELNLKKDNYYYKITNTDLNKLIKIYIPIKSKYLVEGINLINSFIEKHGIKANILISKLERLDSIIIKVNSFVNVKRITYFIKNNSFFKNSLNKVNPLIFNMDDCMIVLDDNLSFINELSKVLYAYIKDSKVQGSKTKPNIKELKKYINNISLLEKNETLKLIYKQIIMKIDGTLNQDAFNELVIKYQDLESILINALRDTREKYNSEQTVNALTSLLDGNANYITDSNKGRTNILNYLDLSQINLIIKKYSVSGKIDNETLSNFLKHVNSTRYKNIINVFKYAFNETINKYKYNKVLKYALIKDVIVNKKFNVITNRNNARHLIDKYYNLNLLEIYKSYYNLEELNIDLLIKRIIEDLK